MKKVIFALVQTETQANNIVDRLLSSNFSNEEISILFPDKANRAKTAYGTFDTTSKKGVQKSKMTIEKKTKASEGAVTGAVLGGSLGLLVGIGALAIPGIGPFIAAGPIVAALSGSAVGGGVGLLVGSLVGAGIPEFVAKKYEMGLKQGNILLCVDVGSDEDVKRVNDILKRDGATDISTTTETTKSRF